MSTAKLRSMNLSSFRRLEQTQLLDYSRFESHTLARNEQDIEVQALSQALAQVRQAVSRSVFRASKQMRSALKAIKWRPSRGHDTQQNAELEQGVGCNRTNEQTSNETLLQNKQTLEAVIEQILAREEGANKWVTAEYTRQMQTNKHLLLLRSLVALLTSEMEARELLTQSIGQLSAFADERGVEADKILEAHPVIERCNKNSIAAMEAVIKALKLEAQKYAEMHVADFDKESPSPAATQLGATIEQVRATVVRLEAIVAYLKVLLDLRDHVDLCHQTRDTRFVTKRLDDIADALPPLPGDEAPPASLTDTRGAVENGASHLLREVEVERKLREHVHRVQGKWRELLLTRLQNVSAVLPADQQERRLLQPANRMLVALLSLSGGASLFTSHETNIGLDEAPRWRTKPYYTGENQLGAALHSLAGWDEGSTLSFTEHRRHLHTSEQWRLLSQHALQPDDKVAMTCGHDDADFSALSEGHTAMAFEEGDRFEVKEIVALDGRKFFSNVSGVPGWAPVSAAAHVPLQWDVALDEVLRRGLILSQQRRDAIEKILQGVDADVEDLDTAVFEATADGDVPEHNTVVRLATATRERLQRLHKTFQTETEVNIQTAVIGLSEALRVCAFNRSSACVVDTQTFLQEALALGVDTKADVVERLCDLLRQLKRELRLRISADADAKALLQASTLLEKRRTSEGEVELFVYGVTIEPEPLRDLRAQLCAFRVTLFELPRRLPSDDIAIQEAETAVKALVDDRAARDAQRLAAEREGMLEEEAWQRALEAKIAELKREAEALDSMQAEEQRQREYEFKVAELAREADERDKMHSEEAYKRGYDADLKVERSREAAERVGMQGEEQLQRNSESKAAELSREARERREMEDAEWHMRGYLAALARIAEEKRLAESKRIEDERRAEEMRLKNIREAEERRLRRARARRAGMAKLAATTKAPNTVSSPFVGVSPVYTDALGHISIQGIDYDDSWRPIAAALSAPLFVVSKKFARCLMNVAANGLLPSNEYSNAGGNLAESPVYLCARVQAIQQNLLSFREVVRQGIMAEDAGKDVGKGKVPGGDHVEGKQQEAKDANDTAIESEKGEGDDSKSGEEERETKTETAEQKEASPEAHRRAVLRKRVEAFFGEWSFFSDQQAHAVLVQCILENEHKFVSKLAKHEMMSVNFSETEDMLTPIMIAGLCGSVECVQVLAAEAGADVDTKGTQKKDVNLLLMMCNAKNILSVDSTDVKRAKQKIVDILLRHGADVEAATEVGCNALWLAVNIGEHELAKLICAEISRRHREVGSAGGSSSMPSVLVKQCAIKHPDVGTLTGTQFAPLHVAVVRGDVASCSAILECAQEMGHEVLEQVLDLEAEDHLTALKLVELLLESGPDQREAFRSKVHQCKAVLLAKKAESDAEKQKQNKKYLTSVRVVTRMQQLYRKAQQTIASVKNYRRVDALDKVRTERLTMVKHMSQARNDMVEKQRLAEEEAAHKAEQEAEEDRLKQLREEAKQRAEAQAAEDRRRREEEERAKEAQRLAEEAAMNKPDEQLLLQVAGSGPAGLGGEGVEEIVKQISNLVSERHTPLESLDSLGRTPLLVAAASGCVEAAAALIDLGADTSALSVDKMDALGYAVEGDHEHMTRYLMGQSVEGARPKLVDDKLPSVERIHAAILVVTETEEDASLNTLRAILESDLVQGPASEALNAHDEKASSVLFRSTMQRHIKILELLCACKSIDVDADHSSPSTENPRGMSAMQWAAREAASKLSTGKGSADEDISDLLKIVGMLLAAGASAELISDPNGLSQGSGSPLGDAILSGSRSLVDVVLGGISPSSSSSIVGWCAHTAVLLCEFGVLQDLMKKFPSVLTDSLDDLIYTLHGINAGRIVDGMTFPKVPRTVSEGDRTLAKEAADRVFGDEDTCTFERMKKFLKGDELFHSLRDRYGKKSFREAMNRVLLRLTQIASKSSTVVTRQAFEHWFASGWLSIEEAIKKYVHVSNSMAKNMSVDEILAMARTMEGHGASDPDPEMLLDAVNDGDLATAINLIVKNGTDIDSAAEDGYTALMRGSAFGEVQCVEALIKLKADVNHVGEDGTTALIIAAYQNDPNITRALCQFGKRNLNVGQPMGGNNASALYLAAQEGHVDVLKEILAIPGGVAPEVLNAQVNGGITASYIAAYEGRAEILEALVKAKSDVNLKSDQGATPLFVALQNHHYECTKILLENGADPDTQTTDGTSVLSVAIFDGDVEAVEALLRAGVTLAEPESGGTGKEKDSQFVNTPDVSAAFVGHFDILGVIVREMNRLNIPTRYEPVLKSIFKLTLEQAVSINHKDVVLETEEQQRVIAKGWFDKYGTNGGMTRKQFAKNLQKIGLRKRYGKFFNALVSLLFRRSDENHNEYLNFEEYAENIENLMFLKSVPTGKQLEKLAKSK